MKLSLDKVGGVGAVVAAAACPICFPKLALVGALFGLGAFSAYEYQFLIAAQILVAIAVLGHALGYLRHRRGGLLAAALASGAAVFAGLYAVGSELLVYAGFAGLVAVSFRDVWRWAHRPAATSILTCPGCGKRKREAMPKDACLFFYECTGCGALLRPKPEDCCVFCSYGSVRCPPRQAA